MHGGAHMSLEFRRSKLTDSREGVSSVTHIIYWVGTMWPREIFRWQPVPLCRRKNAHRSIRRRAAVAVLRGRRFVAACVTLMRRRKRRAIRTDAPARLAA